MVHPSKRRSFTELPPAQIEGGAACGQETMLSVFSLDTAAVVCCVGYGDDAISTLGGSTWGSNSTLTAWSVCWPSL